MLNLYVIIFSALVGFTSFNANSNFLNLRNQSNQLRKSSPNSTSLIGKLSLIGSFSLNSNHHRWASTDNVSYATYSVGGSYLFNDFTLAGSINTLNMFSSYDNQIKFNGEPSFSISYKPWEISEQLSLSSFLNYRPGWSRVARRYTTFHWSVGGSHSVNYKLSRLGMKNTSLGLYLSYGRNFHKEEVTIDGSSNSQYSLSSTFSISHSFLQKWAVTTALGRSFGWTYQGNQKDTFAFITSVDYQMTDRTGLNFTYENAGSMIASNGKDINLSIYDEHEAGFSLGLNYLLL